MSESTTPQKLTSPKFIADTNVAIEFINDLSRAEARLLPNTTVLVTSTVLGELFYGAWNSAKREKNVANIERLIEAFLVLSIDLEVSRRYGEARKKLERKGRRIPENDIWIAATALAHNLPLATRDGHFKEVDGLAILDW